MNKRVLQKKNKQALADAIALSLGSSYRGSVALVFKILYRS